MAYGSNPGPAGGGNPGGAGDDYFGGGQPPKEMAPKEEGEKHPTGVLPKELMAGKEFNVGDEIVLKITGIHENDFTVEYSYGEEAESKEPEHMGEMAGAEGGGGMSSYME
jgi:hypothetical protein